MAKAPNWTKEEVAYLHENWENIHIPMSEICSTLNRKMKTISAKARGLGLFRGRNSTFTRQDIEILREFSPTMMASELKEKFFPDKTREQIAAASCYYKIKKDENMLAENLKERAIENLKNIPILVGADNPRWVERIGVKCTNCGETLYKLESEIKDMNFCEMSCYGEYRKTAFKGENNPNWNGGYITLKSYGREKALKQWRLDSIKNSNYKCVISKEPFQEVHHIVSYDTIFKETVALLTFAEENDALKTYTVEELEIFTKALLLNHAKYPMGVCLTKELHMDFHNKYGRGKNTQEQWNEFLDSLKNE